jgi:addiction module HigA family antidote
MNLPSYKLHQLSGQDKGTWAVWVIGNWRVTFRFERMDAILVNYLDYHWGVFFMNLRKPTHPGEVLREDIIEPLGIAITGAAKHLGVTRKTLSALLNTRASLSPEMAVRVSKATRTTPESWIYMQAKYDLWKALQKSFEVDEFIVAEDVEIKNKEIIYA